MTALEYKTRLFWNASFFIKRAVGRNSDSAITGLKIVAATTTGTVKNRAENLLRETNEQSSGT